MYLWHGEAAPIVRCTSVCLTRESVLSALAMPGSEKRVNRTATAIIHVYKYFEKGCEEQAQRASEINIKDS